MFTNKLNTQRNIQTTRITYNNIQLHIITSQKTQTHKKHKVRHKHAHKHTRSIKEAIAKHRNTQKTNTYTYTDTLTLTSIEKVDNPHIETTNNCIQKNTKHRKTDTKTDKKTTS